MRIIALIFPVIHVSIQKNEPGTFCRAFLQMRLAEFLLGGMALIPRPAEWMVSRCSNSEEKGALRLAP